MDDTTHKALFEHVGQALENHPTVQVRSANRVL